MKFKQVKFPYRVKVLQILSNTYAYTKEERSYDVRKENIKWDIWSKSGYVAENKLYLPETALDNVTIGPNDVLTMEDHNFNKRSMLLGGEPFSTNHCFDISEPNKTNIFELRQAEEMELYLAKDNYNFPWRKTFKVCELRQGEPVEIKLNFKSFYALWGTQRYLSERSYIYEYLGDFDSCYTMREPFDAVKKEPPPQRKEVNLLKKLWM